MNIKIKYFNDDYPRLEKTEKGDLIDLRVDDVINMQTRGYDRTDEAKVEFNENNEILVKSGDIIKFGLGIAMELPDGYEAVIIPRSSMFKNWGLMQTNSVGLIDNSYCGNNDEWMIEMIALKNKTVNRFDRVCQFRIQKNQPKINFEEVDKLNNKDRNGYGSTGKN